MRHRRRVKHFSRKSGPRKALLRGLMISLVEHERITTTVEKAKELRRHIERAITTGKAGDLAARRLLLSRISNEKAVDNIVGNLAVRFKSRPGGYTRIIKIGRRPGDKAEMAFIEFVDYQFDKVKGSKASKDSSVASGKDTHKEDKKSQQKGVTGNSTGEDKDKKLERRNSRALVAKKKSVRRKQNRSRQSSRGA